MFTDTRQLSPSWHASLYHRQQGLARQVRIATEARAIYRLSKF